MIPSLRESIVVATVASSLALSGVVAANDCEPGPAGSSGAGEHLTRSAAPGNASRLVTAGRAIGQAAAAAAENTAEKVSFKRRPALAAPGGGRQHGLRERPLAAGEKISLSTRKADLVEVLRSFAILADVNLVLDPDVQGEVTVELHEVAWEDALAVILRTHRLAAEVDGRIWLIRKP